MIEIIVEADMAASGGGIDFAPNMGRKKKENTRHSKSQIMYLLNSVMVKPSLKDGLNIWTSQILPRKRYMIMQENIIMV